MSYLEPKNIKRPHPRRRENEAKSEDREETKEVGGEGLFRPKPKAAQKPEKDKGNDTEFPYLSGVSRVQVHFANLPFPPKVVALP